MAEKKKSWDVMDVLHEENVDKLYWMAINRVKDGKYDEAISIIKNHIMLTPRILERYLKNKELKPLINISKATLCYYTMALYIKAECNECILKTIKLLAEQVELSIAFERLLKGEDDNSKIKEMTKNLLKGLAKEHAYEFILLISHMSDEIKEMYFNEIFNIAKFEFGESQYMALNVLQGFINKKEVLDLFKFLASDWDKKVRRICLNALFLLKENEDIKQLAKKLIKDETDETNAGILKLIIENNKNNGNIGGA